MPPWLRLSEIAILYKKKRKEKKSPSKLLKYRSSNNQSNPRWQNRSQGLIRKQNSRRSWRNLSPEWVWFWTKTLRECYRLQYYSSLIICIMVIAVVRSGTMAIVTITIMVPRSNPGRQSESLKLKEDSRRMRWQMCCIFLGVKKGLSLVSGSWKFIKNACAKTTRSCFNALNYLLPHLTSSSNLLIIFGFPWCKTTTTTMFQAHSLIQWFIVRVIHPDEAVLYIFFTVRQSKSCKSVQRKNSFPRGMAFQTHETVS